MKAGNSVRHFHSIEFEGYWGELTLEEFASTMKEFTGLDVKVTIEAEVSRHRPEASGRCKHCAEMEAHHKGETENVRD